MDRSEKAKFVKELCRSVEIQLVLDIASGKVPEDWNGIELRWLLERRFSEDFYRRDNRRRRQFLNEVATRNL